MQNNKLIIFEILFIYDAKKMNLAHFNLETKIWLKLWLRMLMIVFGFFVRLRWMSNKGYWIFQYDFRALAWFYLPTRYSQHQFVCVSQI